MQDRVQANHPLGGQYVMPNPTHEYAILLCFPSGQWRHCTYAQSATEAMICMNFARRSSPTVMVRASKQLRSA